MVGIRKHEPVSEKEMFHRSPLYTICEVLREIYLEANQLQSNGIQKNARIAVSMAKAMDIKLREYNNNWMDGFYEYNQKPRVKHELG